MRRKHIAWHSDAAQSWSHACFQYTGPTRRGAGVRYLVALAHCLANPGGLASDNVP